MHAFVIGRTGSGKTREVLETTCVLNALPGKAVQPHIICLDCKGTILRETARAVREAGYRVVPFDLAAPRSAGRWNPLSTMHRALMEDRPGDADLELSRLSGTFKGIVRNDTDRYWQESAWNTIAGVAKGLSLNFGKEPSLGDVYDVIANDAILSALDRELGARSPAALHAAVQLTNVERTWNCMRSTCASMLAFFTTTAGRAIAGSSTVDFARDLVGSRKPRAFYIVIPDTSSAADDYAALLVNTLYQAFCAEHDRLGLEDTDKARPVLFILDEFARLPRMEISAVMSVAAAVLLVVAGGDVRRWLRMAAITAVAVTLVLLLPVTAHAEEPEYHWITDFGGSLRKFICSMILGWATSIFNVYNQLINHVGTEALLSGPFDSLLGTDMYNLTNNIFQTAVIPIGESILALFMLVQLVKISQRIDATSTLPAVKEIVFLAVIYVLLHWFINNSLDIMQAIYGVVNDDIIPTIGSVGDSTGEAGVFSLDGVTQDQWDSMNIGDCFMTLIMSVICLLFGLVAFVLGFAMCYVRAWQIYIYAAFSPIPISLLGFEETRQMGIGFLKNFASVCLAGAILLFLFVAYPFVLAGSVSSLSAGNDILFLMTTSSADSLINLLKGVAISVVLIFMIVKSGGIAKEILGS